MPTTRASKIPTPQKASLVRKTSGTPRKATTPTRPPRATPRRSTATPVAVRSPVRGTTPRKMNTPVAHVDAGPNENGEEGIVVAIRMRPLNSKESTNESAASDVANRVWRVLPQYHSVTQTTSAGQPLPERVTGRTFFSFDRTFGEDATTQNVYDGVAKNIVQSVVTGLNGTIFAYGQTSSGKTYTMQGSGSIEEGRQAGGGGVVHMAASDIFGHILNTPDRIFLVRTSFIEIYNEEVRDLLGGNAALQVREDPRKGVFVSAAEEIVTDFETLLRILFAGEKNRAVAATGMNERSSRSHTIFRITIESRKKSEERDGSPMDDGAVLISTLNLVDLAGSESVRHTGATGERQKEGAKINQSLLTLSRVIVGLGQPNQAHINFRDSKLTRILQPSLSGNARMAVVCCATPSELYLEETRSTLQFASRAKLVKTKAQVNEVLDDRSMIKRLQRELAEARRQSVGTGQTEHMKTLESEAAKADNAAKEAESKLLRLKSSLLNSAVIFGTPHVDLASSGSDASKSKPRLRTKKRRLSDGHIHVDRTGMLTPLKENVEISTPQSMRHPVKTESMRQIHAHLSPNSELSLVRTAYDSKVEQSKTLQGTVTELEQKLALQVKKNEDLVQNIESLEYAKTAAKQSISDLESEKTELWGRFEKISGERVRGAFELAQANSEREKLAKELSQRKEETQSMSEDISLLKATLKDAIDEKKEESQRLGITRAELATVSGQKDEFKQQVTCLTKSLSEREHELELVRSERIDIDKHNAQLEEQVARFTSELKVATEKIEELSSVSEERQGLIDKLEVTAERIQMENQDEIGRLTSTNSQQMETIAQLEGKVEQLSKEKVASDENVKDLSASVGELTHTVQVTEQNLAETESKLNTTTAKLESTLESLDEQREKLNTSADRVRYLETATQEIKEVNEKLECHVTDLSSQIDDTMIQFVELEATKHDLEDQLEGMGAELEATCAERQLLSEEMQAQTEKLVNLAEARDAALSSLQSAETLKLNMNDTIKQLEEEREERKSRILVLEEENSGASSYINTLEAGKATFESHLADAVKNCEMLTAENRSLTEQLADRQDAISAISLEQEGTSSSLAALELQMEEYRATEQRLKDQQLVLASQLEAVTSEKESEAGKVESFKAALSELEDRNAELESRLTDVTQTNVSLVAKTEDHESDLVSCARERDEAVAVHVTQSSVLESTRDELNSLRSKVMDLEAENIRVLQERTSLSDEAQALRARQDECDRRLQLMSEEREALLQARDTLDAEVSELRQNQESFSNNEVESLQKKLAALEDESSDVKQLLVDANEKVTEAREAAHLASEELNEKTQSLTESIRRISELENEMQTLSERKSITESKYGNKESERLGSELESLMEEKLRAEESLQAEINRRERSEEEAREEHRAIIAEAESCVKSLQDEIKQLQSTLSHTEAEAYAAKQEKEELQDLNRRLEDKALEAEVLRDSEKILKSKLTTLSEQKGHLEATLDALQKAGVSRDQEEHKVETIKAELNRVRAESYSLTQQVQDLRLEIDKSRLEKEKLDRDARRSREESLSMIASLESENRELLGRLRTLEVEGKENHISTEEASKIQQKLIQMSSELKTKDARIQKLNATKLTKDQCVALKKLKEERVQFQKDADEYRNRWEDAQKEIVRLTSKLSQISASYDGDASLKFEKEALETKFRKYAAHCQRLESEKAMMKDALDSVHGLHVERGDVTTAVVEICDRITSLEEECEALSSAENKASSFLSELDRLRDENSSLHESISNYQNKLAEVTGSEDDLKSKLDEMTDKIDSLRRERDGLKSVAESAQGNAETLENEKTRQVRYLEQENLQLMLDLKNAKKQLQRTRKELDAKRLSVADDDTMDFGSLPITTTNPPKTAQVGPINDEFSTGWMKADSPIDKENQHGNNPAQESENASATESAKRRFPRIPKSAKKKLRNMATPGRRVGLGEATNTDDENTTECKQS